VANDLVLKGWRFIRYDQDSAGFWWVVVTR
jgi:hypothetical protein